MKTFVKVHNIIQQGKINLYAGSYEKELEYLPDKFCFNCGHKGIYNLFEIDWQSEDYFFCKSCQTYTNGTIVEGLNGNDIEDEKQQILKRLCHIKLNFNYRKFKKYVREPTFMDDLIKEYCKNIEDRLFLFDLLHHGGSGKIHIDSYAVNKKDEIKE